MTTLIRDGWYVDVVPIARQEVRLSVYNTRGELVLQGLGDARWRPNHDPGDEDPGDSYVSPRDLFVERRSDG